MVLIFVLDFVLVYDDNCGVGGVIILGGFGGGGLYDQMINIVNFVFMGINVFLFVGILIGVSGDVIFEVMIFGDIDGIGGNEEMWIIIDEDFNVIGIIGVIGFFFDQCNIIFIEIFMIFVVMIDVWVVDGQIDFIGIDVVGNINIVFCGGDFLLL